jgi:multiple sugar transport system permease protein
MDRSSLISAGAKGGSALSLEAKDRRLGYALIAPSLVFFAVLIIYPLAASVWLGFTTTNTITQSGRFVGLDNYAALLSDNEFWISLSNNLVWTISTLALQVTLGVALALMLHQNMVFRALARSLLLFPYLLPTVVAVLVWRWLLNDLNGIVNYMTIATGLVTRPIDWLGRMPNAMLTVIAIGTWKYFPFVVLAVLARLQTIPEQLYEAARMDGAGTWARFWDITLPQLRGVLVIVIILRAIWDFKEFDLIYLMTGGGPLTGTQTLPLMVYKAAFALLSMGRAAAIAVAMLLIMLVLMIAYFVSYGRDSDEA